MCVCVLRAVLSPPDALCNTATYVGTYVERARISSFLGNHKPEVVGKIISLKSGYTIGRSRYVLSSLETRARSGAEVTSIMFLMCV